MLGTIHRPSIVKTELLLGKVASASAVASESLKVEETQLTKPTEAAAAATEEELSEGG